MGLYEQKRDRARREIESARRKQHEASRKADAAEVAAQRHEQEAGRASSPSAARSKLRSADAKRREAAKAREAATAAVGKLAKAEKDLHDAERKISDQAENQRRKREREDQQARQKADRAAKTAAQRDERARRESARQALLSEQQQDLALSEVQSRVVSLEQATADAREKAPSTVTVLFITASPVDQVALRVDKEFREIQQRIRASEYRNHIKIETRQATQPRDLLDAFNEVKPDIAHFSGHAGIDGFFMEDEQEATRVVTPGQLASVFMYISPTPKLVLFNACESIELAGAALEHIPIVIAMDAVIYDDHAREFAGQFYSALGHGASMEAAFGQARLQMSLATGDESGSPQLRHAPGVDPKAMFLVVPRETAETVTDQGGRFDDRAAAPTVAQHLNMPPTGRGIHANRAAVIVRLDLGTDPSLANWASRDALSDQLREAVADLAGRFRRPDADFADHPSGWITRSGAAARATWAMPPQDSPPSTSDFDKHPPGSPQHFGDGVFEVRLAADAAGLLGARIDLRKPASAAEIREEQIRWFYVDNLVRTLVELLPIPCTLIPASARIDLRGFSRATVISEAGEIGALSDMDGAPSIGVSVVLPQGLNDAAAEIDAAVWGALRRSAGLR
jgi:chemotaxis protein histidine kinase CheA